MKILSHAEAELKKSFAYKKKAFISIDDKIGSYSIKMLLQILKRHTYHTLKTCFTFV